MTIEAFGVGDFNAPKDEFASRDQRMNIVSDANVNHGGSVKIPNAESEGKEQYCPE
jgi:hypothetical protein